MHLTCLCLSLQIANKGCECLTKVVAALAEQGNHALPERILADEQVVGDLMGCLSGPKQPGSQSSGQQVKAIADVLAAVREVHDTRHPSKACSSKNAGCLVAHR